MLSWYIIIQDTSETFSASGVSQCRTDCPSPSIKQGKTPSSSIVLVLNQQQTDVRPAVLNVHRIVEGKAVPPTPRSKWLYRNK